MVRKVKTIKDFVFTLENTVKKQVKNRNKGFKLSSTLIIDFTNNDVKNYKVIYIHASKNEMDNFIVKLNQIKNIDTSELSYKMLKNNDYTSECEWYGMPEYKNSQHLLETATIKMMLETVNISEYMSFINDFYKTFSVIFWPQISTVWYPNRSEKLTMYGDKMYVSPYTKTKYPIYIISKGRYEKRYTSKYLEWCGIHYYIVVEPEEYSLYAEHINPNKILQLPEEYMGKNKGSIPARNFVWSHSKNNGDKRHWILDDNITCYKRYYENEKITVKSSVVFTMIEDYVDRYDNIKMAGHNYTGFAISLNTKLPPITFNTRIYSSILLSNDIFPEFKWRGRYNEDTDLSLRILKANYPTVLFNAILADKLKTLTQKGGNTDSIYAEKDALYKKAKSLEDQHPDVTIITTKFGRTHHHVNYKPFKNLICNKIVNIDNIPNEYGMIFVDKNTSDLIK
jgi:hypothetical protein